MKSVLVWLVGIGIVFGGGGMGMVQFRDAEAKHTYESKLSDIKRDFVTATAPLHFLELDEYRKEIGPHLSRYFQQVEKLGKQFPDFYDIERQRKMGVARMAEGKMSAGQKAARDERIDLALDLFSRMSEGQYRPLYSVTDKGFRFDVYDISPDKVAGEAKVKLSFVHWGPFGANHKPSAGAVSYKSIVGNIKARQEKGKPVEIPQIQGEAQPPSLQVAPERWITEFPPGMELGYYDLPQFPDVAESIQLSFSFGIRTVGGNNLMANIDLPSIDIPDQWKMGEGKEWKAQERFADDAELKAAGGVPTQN